MRTAFEEVDIENKTDSASSRPVYSAGLKDIVERLVAERAKVSEAVKSLPVRQFAPQPYGGD